MKISFQKGDKFGKWKIIGAKIRKGSHYFYPCQCECGIKREVDIYHLKSGNSKSCYDCSHLKHGHKRGNKVSRTWYAWQNMKRRCYDPTNKRYKHYGEKGVVVCERWLGSNGFKNFLEDMGECPESMSLHRINNEGIYRKENCKWTTNEEQMNNMSTNKFLTHKGKTLTLAQWSRITGINQYALSKRKRRGWSDERTLTTPLRKRKT